MTDHLATIIAARLVIAAIDGGGTLEDIVAAANTMRPDMNWPDTILTYSQAPAEPQDAPTEPQDPE